MTRVQILVLAVLSVFVCIVFAGVALVVRNQLLSPDTTTIAEQPDTGDSATPVPTATWTLVPTGTHTPIPSDTPLPTPTYTRVVLDTPTPTPTSTPTITPIPTTTPTPTRRSGGSGSGGSRAPVPTPLPTSRYPLRIVEAPLEYKTKNFIFVVYARITSGNVLLPGYRMIGTHYPTGATVHSEPSCPYLCKASGPNIEDYLIQEGNLAFEAFFYDTGTWSLVIVDPQGQQASEVFQIDIDIKKRMWFYYHFGR